MAEFDAETRAEVRSRTDRLCEYCHLPERFTLVEHQIDHIIALKHGGETEVENLALCCTFCNKNKGSDIASVDEETGRLTPLFHPRLDWWPKHFELRDGAIVPLSDVARVTVKLLRMNHPARIRERKLMRV